MNACIDIGNTRVKLAFFEGRTPKELQIFSHEEKEEVANCLLRNNIERSIVSSSADESFTFDLSAAGKILHLALDTPLPISIDYQGSTLGLDRMANAVGAWIKNKKAALAIDMGTCLTYNYVLNEGFVGGSISPGMRMRLQAMHTFTGRLPLIVDLHDVPLISNSTPNSLLSGTYYGILAEVDAQIAAFYERHPDGSATLTGGDAPRFAQGLKNPIFVDPLLTLRGLNEILLHHAD